MKKQALLVFVSLSLLETGCTVTQPIRPVARNAEPYRNVPPRQAVRKPAPVNRRPAPATKTYPIGNREPNIRVEPNAPALGINPMAPPVESATANPDTAVSRPGGFAPSVPAYAVEDARLPAGSSPAVVALLSEADRSRAAGDLDAAVVATERALRIDSRNPTLTYKLAQLRIKQNKPRLAEELAGKAALLAGANLELKRKSWLLIAEARRMQQNYQGASEAKTKAESFFRHW